MAKKVNITDTDGKKKVGVIKGNGTVITSKGVKSLKEVKVNKVFDDKKK